METFKKDKGKSIPYSIDDTVRGRIQSFAGVLKDMQDELPPTSPQHKAIDIILSDEDVTVEKFLEGSRGEDANLENEYINEAFDDFKINGNFVMNYFKMATEDFRVEVECKVRNKILKKYRKK